MFAFLQIMRVISCQRLIKVDGFDEPVSQIYAYAFFLAKRRGIAEERNTTKQIAKDQEDENTGDRFDEESEWQKKSNWRKEFTDTYRHMREHGNSAFIFILELILAVFCFCLLKAFSVECAAYKVSAIGVLLSIWALPAVFVHFLGQSLERRFSLYERRLKNDNPITKGIYRSVSPADQRSLII